MLRQFVLLDTSTYHSKEILYNFRSTQLIVLVDYNICLEGLRSLRYSAKMQRKTTVILRKTSLNKYTNHIYIYIYINSHKHQHKIMQSS